MAHPGLAFQTYDLPATVLAQQASSEEAVPDDVIQSLIQRGGKRFTPVSDWLHARLRPLFASMILDDHDFTETFDRLEVLFGALAHDAETEFSKPERLVYMPGPWVGAFSWRDRHSRTPLEALILSEQESAGDAWPPLAGGLFGGSADRAHESLAAFKEYAQGVRRTRPW